MNQSRVLYNVKMLSMRNVEMGEAGRRRNCAGFLNVSPLDMDEITCFCMFSCIMIHQAFKVIYSCKKLNII